MKIAIIADSHDNLANLKRAIGWIKKEKIKLILHLGDVSKEEILGEALEEYSGRIFLVKGNCDLEDFEKIKKIKVFDSFGTAKFGGKKIAFSHFPKVAQTLALGSKYDLVFYGHDHKPWVTNIGATRLTNPGNLAGVFYKATFATYNTKTDKLVLKIIERL